MAREKGSKMTQEQKDANKAKREAKKTEIVANEEKAKMFDLMMSVREGKVIPIPQKTIVDYRRAIADSIAILEELDLELAKYAPIVPDEDEEENKEDEEKTAK